MRVASTGISTWGSMNISKSYGGCVGGARCGGYTVLCLATLSQERAILERSRAACGAFLGGGAEDISIYLSFYISLSMYIYIYIYTIMCARILNTEYGAEDIYIYIYINKYM